MGKPTEPVGMAAEMLISIARIYCSAKAKGCSVQAAREASSPWHRASLAKAEEYSALLDQCPQVQQMQLTEEAVLQRLREIYEEKRVREEEAKAQLNPTPDAIADAVAEMRALGQLPGVYKHLVGKYGVDEDTLRTYRRLLGPLFFAKEGIDTIRRVALAVAEQQARPCREDAPHLTELEELMLLEHLHEQDQATGPMSSVQFVEFLRGIVRELICDNARQDFVESNQLKHWALAFRKRYQTELSCGKFQELSDDQTKAYDSGTIDAWIAAVKDLEQGFIQERNLPLSGLQPFQVLMYDEFSLEREDEGSSDALTCGSLLNAAGVVLSTELVQTAPDQPTTDDELEDEVSGDSQDKTSEPLTKRRNEHVYIPPVLERICAAIERFRSADERCEARTIMVLVLDRRFSGTDDVWKMQKIVDLCGCYHAVRVIFLTPHLSSVLESTGRGYHAHFKVIFSRILEHGVERKPTRGKRKASSNSQRTDVHTAFDATVTEVANGMGSKAVICSDFLKCRLLPRVDGPGFEDTELPQWYIPRADRQNSFAALTSSSSSGSSGATSTPSMAEGLHESDDKENRPCGQKLATNRKRNIFALYCDDQGVDLKTATDEQLLPLSDRFDEAITDKSFKDDLEQRSKKPRGRRRPRAATDEARVLHHLKKPAFKMFLVHALGRGITKPEPAAIEMLEVYDMASKEDLVELAEEWQNCSQNSQVRMKLQKHLKTTKFREYCYHTFDLIPEQMSEYDQLGMMVDYFEAHPEANPPRMNWNDIVWGFRPDLDRTWFDNY